MGMRCSRSMRAGGGGLADKMFPGWQDKLWAKYSPGVQKFLVNRENNTYEAAVATHKKWQNLFVSYKSSEASWAPSSKYRKPYVDWRRQIERGTMHFGRWYEGPHGSNYIPGNTVDRL